jgi:hypothetical protein
LCILVHLPQFWRRVNSNKRNFCLFIHAHNIIYIGWPKRSSQWPVFSKLLLNAKKISEPTREQNSLKPVITHMQLIKSKKNLYSLRPILLFAIMDVSRQISKLDTSILMKSNMGRRIWKLINQRETLRRIGEISHSLAGGPSRRVLTSSLTALGVIWAADGGEHPKRG